MAHNAAVLELPVDPLELYRCDDPDALGWLEGLIARVSATNQAQHERLERERAAIKG